MADKSGIETPISEVFSLATDLAFALGARNIKDLPGCYEAAIDEHWWMAINPHESLTKCSKDAGVPGYSIFFYCNGWPAGIVTLYGGALAANEDELCRALTAAIAKLGSEFPSGKKKAE